MAAFFATVAIFAATSRCAASACLST